ncbi:MAG: sensor histidine kinase [Aliarcobacter sp.]|nr:sensor histidine kinase [Aliarcobacter sp.]
MGLYQNNKINLGKILSQHFVKFSLIPILIVEVTLIILYFSINAYISSHNVALLLNEAVSYSQSILENEARFIDEKLVEVSRNASILKYTHENIMNNSEQFNLTNFNVNFDVAPNGVFYKTNENGASLYYSSKTKITNKEKNKAIFTEAMDVSLKSVVDTNPIINAAYFNTWDNMNRLYPFINKVYEQYGEHIRMEDYNFYYLADLKHNPEKKAVWTSAYLDPAGNGWMLSCVVPIYNKEFLEGVTGIDITIDNFVKNILDRKLPYDANLFMVDKDGMIIAMPEKIESLLGLKELKEHLYTDSILKTISKPEEYNILTNKSPFASHFKNLIENKETTSILKIENKEYLTLSQNIDETNWKLMILIDKKNVFSSIENLKSLSDKIGYVAILFLIFFYIVFFYFLLKKINIFSNSITKPIVDLSNQSSQISEKNSNIEILNTNILEIHQLSSNFVSMMNELNERTKKLIDAKIFAEEANKSKDDFLANMSHELKTPLNSINIISGIMMKNKSSNLTDQEVKNLEIVNKCGKDLLDLINDILDLSKLEAKEDYVQNIKINVNEYMTSIYEMFYTQIKMKNLEFIFKVDEDLDYIYSDQIKIKQIIKNLLSNAIKFTAKGKIYFLVENDKDNIKIIVKDEGIGIPENKLEDIFNRFKQLDGSTTRKYGGTGLGLAICKELALLLNGQITVSSQINIGSIFEVLIPKNKIFILDVNERKLSNKLEDNNSNHENLRENELIKVNQMVNKETIYILNNDPLYFFDLIVDLNKLYVVKQVTKVTQLFLIEENNPKIIIDISKLEQIEKEKIKEISTTSLIILYDNDIEDDLRNIAFEVYKKPVSSKVLSKFYNDTRIIL